jgi:hypothetical protein
MLGRERIEPHGCPRLRATADTHLEENSLSQWSCLETRSVREPYIALDPGLGLDHVTIARGEAEVNRRRAANLLEYPVASLLPESWRGDQENVDILRKPLDEAISLGETGSALEDGDRAGPVSF